MNSTKKNQSTPPLPLLDPKKTYTFFFSEHLQHENQTIEIITHELQSILKCNISYFLNEKVDVVVDTKYNISKADHVKSASSPFNNSKNGNSSSSSGSLGSSDVHNNNSTGNVKIKNSKKNFHKNKKSKKNNLKYFDQVNNNIHYRHYKKIKRKRFTQVITNKKSKDKKDVHQAKKKRKKQTSSRSQLLVSMATTLTTSSPKRNVNTTTTTPITSKSKKNIRNKIRENTITYVVVEDVMQYVQGRRRELNISTKVEGNRRKRRSSSSYNNHNRNISNLLLQYEVSPCLRVANGIGKEEIESFKQFFESNRSDGKSSVPQIQQTSLPGVSPFCPYTNIVRATSKGYAALYTSNELREIAEQKLNRYKNVFDLPWWVKESSMGNKNGGVMKRESGLKKLKSKSNQLRANYKNNNSGNGGGTNSNALVKDTANDDNNNINNNNINSNNYNLLTTRSKLSNENKRGYCEICREGFLDLKAHCKTKAHLKIQESKYSYEELDLFVKELYTSEGKKVITKRNTSRKKRDVTKVKDGNREKQGNHSIDISNLVLPSSITGYKGWEKHGSRKKKNISKNNY